MSEGRGDWEPDNSYPGRSRTAGRPRSGLGQGLILAVLLVADTAFCSGLVLVDAVVDDLQDLDGTKRGA